MLFFLVGWLHVLLSPYTKVEESFNLHATHDITFYGLLPSALPCYDHFVFPGVVPRSFIGSLALSGAAAPLYFLGRALNVVNCNYTAQVIVRLTLATANAAGLLQLQRAVRRRFGATTAIMFLLLTCTQFHVPFWMGRTLPNMFALLPVTLACAWLVASPMRNSSTAIALLTFAAATLRAELVLLLGPIVLQAIFLRHITLLAIVKTGFVAGTLSLALTVLVDSYFWNRWPLWPELASLYFNVYEGKSAEWGTSASHTYFSTHLPKLLLSSLPLSLLGLVVDPQMRTLLLPSVTFVALLSCLGHKEWRFVVYVVPLWNIVGARGAAWLLSGRGRGLVAHALKLILSALLTVNVLITILLTQASMVNYPGGEALAILNNILVTESGPVTVHIGNYAAQTGASLFLHELAPRVTYNKTENLVAPRDFDPFNWVITEDASAFGKGWQIDGIVDGLKGVELHSLGTKGINAKVRIPKVMKEPKLWLLRHAGG